jgi:tetratricopeptide (TPR) repeat protein
MRSGLAFLAFSLLCSDLAHAEPAARVHVTAPFWRAVKNPALLHAETLARQGREHLYPALGLSMLLGTDAVLHRRASLENAIARFERAHQLAPEDAEITYLSARALSLWERRHSSGQIERRTEEAIERFLALRARHPSYRDHETAFELGVLYMHSGNVERAAAEYETALKLRVDEGSRSAPLCNLAEVTMMAGDLERATELYERAAAEGLGEERVLALLGWSVALDRLGERSESMLRAREAIKEDQRPLGALRQSGVFFVPPYELHYYEGIGQLALAEQQADQHAVLLDAARRFETLVGRDASLGLLLSFKQVLAALAEEGLAQQLASLEHAVDRAMARMRAKKPGRNAEEPGLDAPEARALLSTLHSLRSFSRYLNAGGDQGPWAADATAHQREILSWFVELAR